MDFLHNGKRLGNSDSAKKFKKLKIIGQRTQPGSPRSLLKLDETLFASANLDQLDICTGRQSRDAVETKAKCSSKKKKRSVVNRSQKNKISLSLKRRFNGYSSSANSAVEDDYNIESADSDKNCIQMAKPVMTITPTSDRKLKQKYLKDITIDESGIAVLPNSNSSKENKKSDNIDDFDADAFFKSARLTQLYDSFDDENLDFILSGIGENKDDKVLKERTDNKQADNFEDGFSQFCANSQVQDQLETVFHSCDSFRSPPTQRNPIENKSSTQRNPIENKPSTQRSPNENKTPSKNRSLVKNVIKKLKENNDCWDETLACGISQLFNSTEYRQEVNSVFENLETSICHLAPGQDKTLDKNTSFNKSDCNLDWSNDSMMAKVDIPQNDSGMSSFIKKNLMNNANRSVSHSRLNCTAINLNETFFTSLGPFYGLPLKVRDLIKQYKGIDKLYDWQDECLKLEAIEKRTNLVYALPTSGGKTLVSEILVLRELLCRKRNAIFVLPYVSIVQEKVWAMSPFAVALDFLIEEYAAGKGVYPPRKRRYKNSVFIATIEKALGLVNSLIEAGRMKELGLIVVDELHLIGEAGRGATLEILLTKLMHADENIHIVGMSATIGNLPDICSFLKAEVYTRDFRPVELKEYVKCGADIFKVNKHKQDIENIFSHERIVNYEYSTEMLNKQDPDRLGALVQEVVPSDSCLVFCATKKNCENVAQLICRVMPMEILEHKQVEKLALLNILKNEGMLCPILNRTMPFGVAYHHSGLTSDERRLIEEGFRAGTLCVICCTSTLAAGVNLPAKRVILRSPYVGREFINLARYKQMVGRAGRAGFGEIGESILICEQRDAKRVAELLCSPMDQAVSSLHIDDGKGLRNLILSCIGLGVAMTRFDLYKVSKCTLLSKQEARVDVDVKACTDKAITDLFKLGAIQLHTESTKSPDKNVSILLQTTQIDNSSTSKTSAAASKSASKKQVVVRNNSRLIISKLGRAAIKGGLDLNRAHMLYDDLVQAQSSLVLLNCLHLLYLVTPYDLAEQIKPSMSTYYSVYIELGIKELQTARVLGITEGCAVKMLSGQTIKNVEPRVLNRFYLTLILHDLWNEKSVFYVAEKYQVNRGIVQQLMTASATFAFCIVNFCEVLEEFWAFADLLRGMSQRLQHCSSKELQPLMELPAVKQGRARQLYRAGFKSLQSIAKADPNDLMDNLDHMTRRVANQLIAAAKLLLLERVENLREEAEDVLDGIDMPRA